MGAGGRIHSAAVSFVARQASITVGPLFCASDDLIDQVLVVFEFLECELQSDRMPSVVIGRYPDFIEFPDNARTAKQVVLKVSKLGRAQLGRVEVANGLAINVSTH
jgi:hypothetical protein